MSDTPRTRKAARLRDGEWWVPLVLSEEMEREIAALKAERDAVELACGELPDGWQVIINMERGAGSVDLVDPDGDSIEVHEDETSISDLVREAIRRAKEAQP